jgi:hypothetical protein
MTAKRINLNDLVSQIATTHNIHKVEAADEVFDAIEILWSTTDWARPEGEDMADWQAEAIRDYIASQYRTNRTRL